MTPTPKRSARPGKARGAGRAQPAGETPRGDARHHDPTTHTRDGRPRQRRPGAGAKPRAGRAADVVLRVRMTEEERTRVDALAARHGLTASEWVRRRALTDDPLDEPAATR